MWILSVIILILILGIIILVHEFGHFIWAKIFHVHIYEFSIGMGPKILTKTGKDGIDYNLRAIPIGGFVAMAGEVDEDDDTKKIPKEKFLCNRPWWQRLIILVAGVVNNFILAVILLFVGAMIWGSTSLDPIVNEAVVGFPVAETGVKSGDKIISINGANTKTWDIAQIHLAMKNKNTADYYFMKLEYENKEVVLIPIVDSKGVSSITDVTDTYGIENTNYYFVSYEDGTSETIVKPIVEVYDENNNIVAVSDISITEPTSTRIWTMGIEHPSGTVEEVSVPEAKEIAANGDERTVLGILVGGEVEKGFVASIKYTFKKFCSIVASMWVTIVGLITGKISLGALSGPVGMYKVIDQARGIGFEYLIYITAFLSINVGFINILPFPAFDGGHVLFIIIEKIIGRPVDSKIENICHTIGFILLLILMIVVTIQDIIRLF